MWPLEATSHCVADKLPQASAAPGLIMGSVRWLSIGMARLTAANRHRAALPLSLAAGPSCPLCAESCSEAHIKHSCQTNNAISIFVI